MTKSLRVRVTQLLASVAIGACVLALTPMLGGWPQTTAQAQYVVAAEFREALSPYGRWQNHSRWGEVWLPDQVSGDWRPYSHGHWVYTDEWGWYWDVASEEADWGWVTYHYGRWVYDGDLGWMWVPGEEWAPAWVDWRYGDDYVGWAPLPPDDLLVEYRDDPVYWCFVQPRYLLAPRVYLAFAPLRQRVVIIRRTKIVNRTVIVDRDRAHGRRVAVNAGINPGIIARATGRSIRATKVEPAVLRGTKVEGAREVDPGEGKRARASVSQSDTVIRPTDKAERPKELGANENGRLGDRPPKAAQDRNDSSPERSSGDNRPRNDRFGDQGRSPPPVNVIRGGVSDSGRSGSPPSGTARERGNQQGQQLQSPPPPSPPVNVYRGGFNDFGRSPPGAGERVYQQGPRIQSPPPPPQVVRRPPPPPPPQAFMRAPQPPPAAVNRAPQEQRGNRPANRQQDDRIR